MDIPSVLLVTYAVARVIVGIVSVLAGWETLRMFLL